MNNKRSIISLFKELAEQVRLFIRVSWENWDDVKLTLIQSLNPG